MISEKQVINILDQLSVVPSESIESDILEFKHYSSEAALHNAKDLAEEITALANLKGGAIIVGVKDSSQVTYGNWLEQLAGFTSIDVHNTRERLRGKIKPYLDLELCHINHGSKIYLVIKVPRARTTLVSTASGKVCIRDGKSSRPMSPDEIRLSVQNLQDYDWSSELIEEGTLDDLNESAVIESLTDFTRHRTIESLTESDFLEAIGVTHNGILTRSGLLFLGKVESIKNKLGTFEYRFSWKTGSGKLIINDVWSDCLWETIKRAKAHFSHCNKNLPLEHKGKEYSVQLLDSVAFHEAYLNALVHRDYAVDGMVSINFSKDRLVITSPGSFYGGVTPDNITKHEPRHRNKALAKMLMEHHMVDRAGMGVLRMGINSLRYGRAFPLFAEKGNAVEVLMQGEYFRPGVFVLTTDNKDNYGIPELLILNSVYEIGATPVQLLVRQLSRIIDHPWEEIERAINQLRFVELCGTRKGIFVRVKPEWADVLDVTKNLRTTTASERHVKLYQYLVRHGEANNADITAHLNFKRTTQTSTFLKKATYVKRSGPRGPGSVWSLRDK